jgi:hypothetical protein
VRSGVGVGITVGGVPHEVPAGKPAEGVKLNGVAPTFHAVLGVVLMAGFQAPDAGAVGSVAAAEGINTGVVVGKVGF